MDDDSKLEHYKLVHNLNEKQLELIYKLEQIIELV